MAALGRGAGGGGVHVFNTQGTRRRGSVWNMGMPHGTIYSHE